MLGAGFGATTSLINDLSSPYGELGGRLVQARWTWVTEVAEVGSLLLDVGWAWAAVAVAAGWLAGAIVRAAAAGAVSLMTATARLLLHGFPSTRRLLGRVRRRDALLVARKPNARDRFLVPWARASSAPE